jgi:hypothetical protein
MAVQVSTVSFPDEQRVRQAPRGLALAPTAAHRQVAEKIVAAGLGHTPLESEAIASALVHPKEAVRQLSSPKGARRPFPFLSEIRTPAGTLIALEAFVWAPHISTYPTNMRAAYEKPFPVAGLEGQGEKARYRPLHDPEPRSADAPGLLLEAESREQVAWTFDRLAAFLKGQNDWSDSIREHGVMAAITLVPITIRHEDGSAERVVLGSGDGSSRVSSSHEILDEHTSSLAYTDDRRRRQIVADVIGGLATDPSDDEWIDKANALAVPARIILGLIDVEGGGDLARAVDFYVGQVHVEPPKAWDDDAKGDARALSALHVLEERGLITPLRRAYLWGDLTPDEAAKAEGCFRYADERAADALQLFTSGDSKVKTAVADGIRPLVSMTQIRRAPKVDAAVELALHAVRPRMKKKEDVRIARAALLEMFRRDELWLKRSNWQVTGRKPEAIRDDALAELAAATWGPSRLELAALGGYYLATTLTLRAARWFATEEVQDGRDAQTVIERIASTPHGIHTLYQAIIDGRAVRDEVRKIDEAGTVETPGDGTSAAMYNRWLRQTFGFEKPPELSLTAKKEEAWRQIRTVVSDLDARMTALAGLRDGDAPIAFVELEGLPRGEVDEVRTVLNRMSETLLRYGVIGQTASNGSQS